MKRMTPELALSSPNFSTRPTGLSLDLFLPYTNWLGRVGLGYVCTTPTGGRLATTYDLMCNRPHTQRIFSGIWKEFKMPERVNRHFVVHSAVGSSFLHTSRCVIVQRLEADEGMKGSPCP
ncbi:hypothetical protein AVEN_249964-1 [Araneus ventricosus]|uniref:Uncharacterized protein n=1 Tax=Araneus ventricosus TaxID=182803 RepID=A0A4Y2KJS8_ARAVE|nr:hypothetical protein AVEN_249964-1 [Araneus ventricosus]